MSKTLNLIATALAVLIFGPLLVNAQVKLVPQAASDGAKISLFATPDEFATPLATISRGEELSAMAETVGVGGAKWYLVKIKSGAIGWIKGSDAEVLKKLEGQFKPLPPPPSSATPLDIPLTTGTTSSRNAIVVAVEVTGSAVLVPVTLNRAIQTRMVLDTGATFSVLSRQIASSLRLKPGSRVTLQTANGKVSAPLAQLGSLKVGEAEAFNLTIAIQDISSNPGLGGLLGLDFLSRYHTSLDSRRQLLTLGPR